MSHSKYRKRGRSLYLDNWNPSARKYINTCSICGKQGYSPSIEEEDFICKQKKFAGLERRAIYNELTKTLKPLPLDSFGRCMNCAEIMDK